MITIEPSSDRSNRPDVTKTKPRTECQMCVWYLIAGATLQRCSQLCHKSKVRPAKICDEAYMHTSNMRNTLSTWDTRSCVNERKFDTSLAIQCYLQNIASAGNVSIGQHVNIRRICVRACSNQDLEQRNANSDAVFCFKEINTWYEESHQHKP